MISLVTVSKMACAASLSLSNSYITIQTKYVCSSG